MSLGEFDTYVDIRIKARVDGKLEKPAGTFNQYAKTHLQGAHIAKEVYEVLGRPNLFKDVLKVTLFAKVKPLILETRPQNTPPQNLQPQFFTPNLVSKIKCNPQKSCICSQTFDPKPQTSPTKHPTPKSTSLILHIKFGKQNKM